MCASQRALAWVGSLPEAPVGLPSIQSCLTRYGPARLACESAGVHESAAWVRFAPGQRDVRLSATCGCRVAGAWGEPIAYSASVARGRLH